MRDQIDLEVDYLRAAFSDAIIIWIDILQRRSWQGARDLAGIERKRRRINILGRYIVRRSGRGAVISPDIDSNTNFFRPDGIHLNLVGLEFYLDYLKDAITSHM